MSAWDIALGNLAQLPAKEPAPIPRATRQSKPARCCSECGQLLPAQRLRAWTAAEDAALRAGLEAGHKHKDIAAELRRPASSITSRIGLLGLSKGRNAELTGRAEGEGPR